MNKITNPGLDAEALYTKSQIYIARGLHAKHDEEYDVYQLWASLALELLAKSSLSGVHPALVADPEHYHSIFAACGRPIGPDIKTIAAKTLFARIGHLVPKFDQRSRQFCEQLALRRNSEIHSGESPFSGMKMSAWEGQFWFAVELLLSFQDKTLEEWLGAKDAKAPQKILTAAKAALKLMVQEKLSHARSDFNSKFKTKGLRSRKIDESRAKVPVECREVHISRRRSRRRRLSCMSISRSNRGRSHSRSHR